jgi:hypothetical protein
LNAETDRAALSVGDVNMYINKLIGSMQQIRNVTIVETRLTTDLHRTYGNGTNWLVYVAQDFKPPKENVSINYFGKGITSNVIVGAWTVYWSATPIADTDSLTVNVNEDLIRSQLSKCSATTGGPLIASSVYQCMQNSLLPSGKIPSAAFIFISSSPGPNVSISNSFRRRCFYFITIDIKCYTTITVRTWWGSYSRTYAHFVRYTFIVFC